MMQKESSCTEKAWLAKSVRLTTSLPVAGVDPVAGFANLQRGFAEDAVEALKQAGPVPPAKSRASPFSRQTASSLVIGSCARR